MSRTTTTTSSPVVWIYSKRHLTTSRRINNPFRVLGLPPNASFETVKKTFIQLAMQHHPDTSNTTTTTTSSSSPASSSSETSTNESSSSSSSSSDKFVAIRAAFEQIRKEHDRRQFHNKPPRDHDDDDDGDLLEHTEEDFLDWFRDLTGVRLTSDQRREMVHLYWKQHKRNGGRHSHGHSWDLARRLVSLQDVFLRNRGKRNPAMNTEETAANAFSTGPKLRRKRPTRR
ncbi:unnamed protein product [Cylindrotheca closterium]|uniref:J domain-containing protein n=1 Tax=Cylindrotheca closterium TaxID=2856 RepID=A0AAD2FS04_9STRA|nr:unnamed protein product [Cylindrotheca closterium]